VNLEILGFVMVIPAWAPLNFSSYILMQKISCCLTWSTVRHPDLPERKGYLLS